MINPKILFKTFKLIKSKETDENRHTATPLDIGGPLVQSFDFSLLISVDGAIMTQNCAHAQWQEADCA